MAPVNDRATANREEFPSFANEALARALGGDTHKGFHALSRETDAQHAENRIRASLDSSVTPRITPGEQPPNIIDVLSSLYSVAARHCDSFPMPLLLGRVAYRPRRVAEELGRFLNITPDSVLRLAAGEMVNDTSVVLRVKLNAGSRIACSP